MKLSLMIKRTKRKFYSEWKANVAIEAIKNPDTLAELTYTSDLIHLEL